MFGALRKKKANLQQADQSAHPQDGTNNLNTKHQSPAISPEDQATLDMMRNKAHSRHPHSKDGEEAAFHAGSSRQHRYGPGDEEEEEEDGLEEEEDDDDDDLFKFMPPPEITENTSYPHKQSSTPSVQSGALLPAHQVTPQHQDPLQTATTVSTMDTDDIVAIPHIPQMHTRKIETPPSVPHTAGASSWEHTSPAKHDQNARPRTAAEQLTDAQRVVRKYQSSQHSAISKRSDSPTDQHASQAVTDNISHSEGAQKRRQPYQYPGSPVYSTTPGTIQPCN